MQNVELNGLVQEFLPGENGKLRSVGRRLDRLTFARDAVILGRHAPRTLPLVVHPLDGPRLKIERAVEHFDNLDREIRAYRARDSYGAVVDYDPPTYRVTVRVRVSENPPPRLGILVGDTVHNLRSALDHLAWQLVSAGGGTPGAGTEFPVFWDGKKYKTSGVGKVQGASPAAMNLLAGLQPYRAASVQTHALYMLHHLDIVDKHRLLNLGVGLLQADDLYKVVQGTCTHLAHGVSSFRPVEDGAILFLISDASGADMHAPLTFPSK